MKQKKKAAERQTKETPATEKETAIEKRDRDRGDRKKRQKRQTVQHAANGVSAETPQIYDRDKSPTAAAATLETPPRMHVG